MIIDTTVPLTIEIIEDALYNGNQNQKLKMMDYIYTHKIYDKKLIKAIKFLANYDDGLKLASAYQIWHYASALLYLITKEHSELYKTQVLGHQEIVDKLISEGELVFKF